MKASGRIAAFVAGTGMVLSAFAHSLLGGPALGAELAKAGASPDLQKSVAVGWHFGGGAMLALGLVVLGQFVGRAEGYAPDRRTLALIAAFYLGFAGWALAISSFNPFFVVFLLPGLLLLQAARSPAE